MNKWNNKYILIFKKFIEKSQVLPKLSIYKVSPITCRTLFIKCVEKWCKVFSLLNLPNLKIVETVMAIPIGNGFVERLFSIIRNTGPMRETV